MALRWYDLRSSHGTITVKASSEAAAREEAAERWGCGTDEVICTGHAPFGRSFVPPADYKRA